MSYSWGPPIWTLFHTIIEHTPEDKFSEVGTKIFEYISRICSLLPCPDCQQHAQKYLKKNKLNTQDKTAVREFIHKFHNAVNKHKNISEHPITILDKYNDMSLADVYNNFIKVFSPRGNIRMISDNMHRSMLIHEFTNWLLTNKNIYYRPKPSS